MVKYEYYAGHPLWSNGEVGGIDDGLSTLSTTIASPNTTGGDWSSAFDSKNLGTTLSGIGTGISLLAGWQDRKDDKKMKKKLFNLEEDRIAQANKRRDRLDDKMDAIDKKWEGHKWE
jgi:hypothetical protein